MSNFFLNQAMSTKRSEEIKDSSRTDAQLKKACQGFESLFVNYLMQQMRETVPESGFMGGGQAEKIYTTMLDGEVAKTVSEQRGIGLAKIMYEQMAVQNRPDVIKK